MASDAHQGKPATDIAILGSAWAPAGKPVRQLDVSATVGPCQKTLRIFGERFWHNGKISSPAEFTHLPIRYENAFGGQHWANEQLLRLETRNPLGKGYRGIRKREEMEGLALPTIEDPRHLIRELDDAPDPAGFGFIAPNWYPRALYSGTYDEQWQHHRAPYLPRDYQPSFQNAAHQDLISQSYLTGGEAVALINMHPSGPIHFFLPRVNLGARVHVSGRPKKTLQFAMETVIVDVDAGQLSMVWKASCDCNNEFPLLRDLNVHLLR